jgi:hypothetical protein
MKNSKALKAILFFLGLFLIVFGAGRVFLPSEFYALNGLTLGDDVSMLNEARGAGGVMLGSGILIMMGVFLEKMRFTSTVIAILAFLSYGIARLIGIAIDGLPNEKIIQGIIAEFIFGITALVAFLKYQKN